MKNVTDKKLLFIFSIIIIFSLMGCGAGQEVDNASDGTEESTEPQTEESVESLEKPATDFPQKPIEVFVGFQPGGGTDVIARAMVELSQEYVPNQAELVVINRPGAGGVTALSEVMSSTPDGYRIIVTASGPLTVAPHFGNTPYKSLDEFEPIINLATMSYFFAVAEDSPYKSFEEIVEYAKENPGQITVGTAGARTAQHLFLEAIGIDIKAEFSHVPFEGDGPARVGLLGGHVDAILPAEASITPYLLDGELRPLAYLGFERHPSFPDVPTVKELGYDDLSLQTLTLNVAVFGPKGLPTEVRDVIHDFMKQGLEDPQSDKMFENINMPKDYMSPDELAEHMQNEYEAFKTVITESGLDQEG